MIKAMFKPFFKRFLGLFISMVFVSMLAVTLLCCFGSCIVDTQKNYQDFVSEYEDVDEIISTEFTSRQKLLSITDLEEVEKADARTVVDCYLYKEGSDRTIVSRVFSYNEDSNVIFKRYPIKSVPTRKDMVNVSVAEKFARNNGFEPGQTIKLGFFEMYADFYISEIVDTPEAIYPRANNYVWSDNHDFGYIYASEAELGKGLRQLAIVILERVAADPDFKEYYERASAVTGITIPDLIEVRNDDNFMNKFANQVLIKNVEGKGTDEVTEKAKKFYEDKEVAVTGAVVRNNLLHIAYMDRALKQLTIASVFLPVFFYSVTMIVVGLFINQIIKTMTPQIGVLMSIGIDNDEIVRLFLLFTTVMGIVASIAGSGAGYLLSILMSSLMKNTYCIPTIAPGLNAFVTIGAIIGLMLFILATTFVATRAIFKITPKDATISNEARRKPLPKAVQKLIDKSPMNIKLGVNSLCQNPRRFFVSAFSIFASLVLIILSSLFNVSKNEMIEQSVERRLNYDCQIYLTQREDDQSFISDLKQQAKSEDEFEECYYTYLKIDTPNRDDVYAECLAIDSGFNPLINIPTSNGLGTLNVSEEGVILPKAIADILNVKKGDSISINNVLVKVSEISFQYFHPITYLSKTQMNLFGVDYVSSFIMNVKNNGDLLRFLSKSRNQCLTVFTDSLSKDLHGIFDAIDSMIYIMIAFSIGMAFVILCIMSQNALLEQRRQLTIFRAIGLSIFDISNIWTLQSVSQLLISSLFDIPVVGLDISILLSLASSSSQTYPFVFSWPTIFMAMGFVLLVVIACHLLAMISIRRWNIADNTRSRE
ncbi:MAG: ABC transporter permease [Bacilli bacterium]|nr:ABC transporter permease [Bacilli bacterium]